MIEWIITAVSVCAGILGIAVYIKENLEAKKRERELNKQIDDLTKQIYKGQLIAPERLISEDKGLIRETRNEVWILGINALGPLHECYEELIKVLKGGGKIRVLLLNTTPKLSN